MTQWKQDVACVSPQVAKRLGKVQWDHQLLEVSRRMKMIVVLMFDLVRLGLGDVDLVPKVKLHGGRPLVVKMDTAGHW